MTDNIFWEGFQDPKDLSFWSVSDLSDKFLNLKKKKQKTKTCRSYFKILHSITRVNDKLSYKFPFIVLFILDLTFHFLTSEKSRVVWNVGNNSPSHRCHTWFCYKPQTSKTDTMANYAWGCTVVYMCSATLSLVTRWCSKTLHICCKLLQSKWPISRSTQFPQFYFKM